MAEDPDFRSAAMTWLDGRPEARVDFSWLSGFEHRGHRVPLMDRQRGIRKPAGFEAALAIRTTYTAPNQVPPYADSIGGDGLPRYKYRGDDPAHHENVALRRAFEQHVPIIWFVGVASGLYEPIYPVWVVADEPRSLEFTLAVHEGQRFLTPGVDLDEDSRRYIERLTKSRLHQRVFRSQVMLAYQNQCTVCHLKRPELLDAAHIVGDGKPLGQPVLPNGLAMCKIHHAAFDAGILGIRPNLTLHIRQDVLDEVDGWMLKGGIQGVHGKRLEVIPRQTAARPSKIRLAQRYELFLAN